MPFPGCPLSIAAKSRPPAAAEGETGAHQIGGAERAEGGIAPAVVHADVLIALAALLDPMKGRLILRIARLHLNRLLHQIRECGCLAGVALNPATSPECLRYVLGDFDLALVMTVNPGFGGQKLIPSAMEKIAAIRAMLDGAGVKAEIEVDGGVNAQTAPVLMEKGATVLVTGSALYSAPDAAAFIRELRTAWTRLHPQARGRA